ncbi:MAG: HAMP domain-containing histidine kinase, partial [Sphingomonadales bacterium]|nr:HAMP domain-containing histidine kinase [Sphingomonadales bacterium]
STAAAHELGTPLGTITLAATEVMNDMKEDNPYREDMAVIAQEALRCREILKQLSSTHADEREDLLRRLPVEALVQLAIDNHKTDDREIIIKLQGEGKGGSGEQPMVSNKPEIIHGIGNFIENAVGFSSQTIEIHIGWDDDVLRISILDDGPGFDRTVVDKLGEPYISTRDELEGVDEAVAGGLGLGVFIAKTLIERTGGQVSFGNSMMGGAQIDIVWPRAVFEEIGTKNSDAGGIPWELQ